MQDLNTEAQSRRLAVLSRESPSAYRVRGYIAAKAVKDQTTISWVWDVFDGDQRRVFRVTGEETAKGQFRDAWAAADDAMLGRIARNSMTQLASFLTSPEVAPSAALPSGDGQTVLAGTQDQRRKPPAFSAYSRPMPIRSPRWTRCPPLRPNRSPAPSRCRAAGRSRPKPCRPAIR